MNLNLIIKLTFINFFLMFLVYSIPKVSTFSDSISSKKFVLNKQKEIVNISFAGFNIDEREKSIQNLFNNNILLKIVDVNSTPDILISNTPIIEDYKVVGYLDRNSSNYILVNNKEINSTLIPYVIKSVLDPYFTDAVLMNNGFFTYALTQKINLNKDNFKKDFFDKKLFNYDSEVTFFGGWMIIQGIIIVIGFFIYLEDFKLVILLGYIITVIVVETIFYPLSIL